MLIFPLRLKRDEENRVALEMRTVNLCDPVQDLVCKVHFIVDLFSDVVGKTRRHEGQMNEAFSILGRLTDTQTMW